MRNPLRRLGRQFGLTEEKLPRVGVLTRPTVPGWALPATQAAAAALLLAGAAGGAGWARHGAFLAGAGVLTLLVVVRPSPGTAGLLLCAAGALLWISGDGPFDPRVLWLAPVGYLLWRATWWAAHVPPSGRVEVAALLAGRRRAAAAVVATELLALAAWAVTTLPGTAPAILLGALALAALAVLAFSREG
ncbi:hypothetical protein GCM10028784_21960 [Myceligenerans cantabricum]